MDGIGFMSTQLGIESKGPRIKSISSLSLTFVRKIGLGLDGASTGPFMSTQLGLGQLAQNQKKSQNSCAYNT